MDSINSINELNDLEKEGSSEKKSHKGIIITGVILFLLAAAYFVPAVYFSGHYLPNTTINGTDVSMMTPKSAMDMAYQEIKEYNLTLVERDDKTENISGKDIGITADFDSDYMDILHSQSGFSWPLSFFSASDENVAKTASYDEEKLIAVIDSLECMDEDNWYESTNATLSDFDSETGLFTMVDGTYGTQIIRENLIAAVEKAVSNTAESVNLSDEDCYVNPEYTASSPKAQAFLDEVNKYAASTVSLTFDSVNEVIDGSVIKDWLDIDYDEMTVSFDESNVTKYVEELAAKYDTVEKDKTLTTSWGTTATVNAGTYGWQMDQESTISLILEYLNSGEDYTGDVVWTQTAESHDGEDFGDTYIEVNISQQHLYLYIDGKEIVSSDFVSGCVSKNRCTDLGAFYVAYKEQDATLKGQDYSTPVEYWMPFFCGEGLHDATWRYSFGGSIFLTSGSHGCINLPHDVAKEIYEAIEPGIAVLVYDPEGIQANALTYYQAQQAAQSESEVENVIKLINKIGKVTKKSKKAISKARSAYDSLTDAQKKKVTNYSTLKKAEKKYKKLKS